MKRLFLGVFGALAVASAAAFTSMGGWAVVTVSKIPSAWIAGKPLQLSWQVRQHGVERLEGLKPTLEGRAGSRRVTGTTWAFDEDGQKGYRGSITFPEPGNWQVTIHSGFGRSRAVLIPWRVVDSGTTVRGTVEAHLEKIGVRAPSESERGRRMFAAMGCATCHMHAAVGIKGEVSDFGPDLTDRRFPPDYLARFLADPSIKPPTNGRQMPSLALRSKDIAPFVAFINDDDGDEPLAGSPGGAAPDEGLAGSARETSNPFLEIFRESPGEEIITGHSLIVVYPVSLRYCPAGRGRGSAVGGRMLFSRM